MSRKTLPVVPARPLAKWPRHRNGNIIGWKHIASNDAGTLARCSVGFVLRTDRLDARGEKVWPPYQQMLSAREARRWLRMNVLSVAFPKAEPRGAAGGAR
jgi:hypothetical protein